MSSIKDDPLYRGRAEGYDLGYKSACEMARREKRTLRIMEWTIAFIAGFILAVATQASGYQSLEITHAHSTPPAIVVERKSPLAETWNAILTKITKNIWQRQSQ